MRFRGAADPRFERGLAAFRSGRFFEAHEEWEYLWNESLGDDRVFLQALIQIAAGCVHVTHGRRAPARRLFALALEKLERVSEDFAPFPLEGLRKALKAPLPEDGPAAGHLRSRFPI